MAKIVDLQSYRKRALAEKSFGAWEKRFQEAYDAQTCLADLSDRTLFSLAQPGEESSFAFYELIMGVLDLGSASKFYYLDKGEQLMVVDIHLFLADQVRFEMMYRLQWIDSYPTQHHRLVEMVRDARELKIQIRGNPPSLADSHPDYAHFMSLAALDRESFIRRMLPKALEEFKLRLNP
jgi:hypothetical protein